MNDDDEDNQEASHSVKAQLLVLSARLDVLEAFVAVSNEKHRIGDSTSSVSVDEWLRSGLIERIDHYLGSLSDENPRFATELSQILEGLKRRLKE
jgi:hypothetical protein